MHLRASTPGMALPSSLVAIGDRTDERIVTMLDAEILRWSAVAPEVAEPLSTLRDFVSAGGKRLRPAFCYWSFVGAGGDPGDPVVVDVGAALELLHTFALVHDDVMDGSDIRRGRAAVHRSYIDHHDLQLDARGEARRFGEGAAILIGDFAFVYADILFASAPAAARPVFDELRLELCVGQYLDLAAMANGPRARARGVLRGGVGPGVLHRLARLLAGVLERVLRRAARALLGRRRARQRGAGDAQGKDDGEGRGGPSREETEHRHACGPSALRDPARTGHPSIDGIGLLNGLSAAEGAHPSGMNLERSRSNSSWACS